jgi:hypothetical protein
MQVFIIYTDTDNKKHISDLCVSGSSQQIPIMNVLIPHIGETFIDRKNKVEYEVKDVIRTYWTDEEEYDIEVKLKRRETKKYR